MGFCRESSACPAQALHLPLLLCVWGKPEPGGGGEASGQRQAPAGVEGLRPVAGSVALALLCWDLSRPPGQRTPRAASPVGAWAPLGAAALQPGGAATTGWHRLVQQAPDPESAPGSPA